MSHANPLKIVITIAIALIIGVLMMACSSQTASITTSSTSEAYSLGSESYSSSTTANHDEQHHGRTSVNIDDKASDDAHTNPHDNASKTMACIGDSITYGHGLDNPNEQSWPALIQAKLGDEWRVVNLGVSGTTLIDEGRYPYRSTGNVEQAKELGADLFIIMLGTNDASDPRFDIESYRTQLTALIDELAAGASRNEQSVGADNFSSQPQFVLMAPPRTFYYLSSDPNADELNRIIGEDIRSVVRSVAAEKGARFVDLYALTKQDPEWFPDYLHPNAEGADAIANYIYEQLFNRA